jgi:hypothetical protein
VTAPESLPTDLAGAHALILAERAERGARVEAEGRLVAAEAQLVDARAEAANTQADLSNTEALIIPNLRIHDSSAVHKSSGF